MIWRRSRLRDATDARAQSVRIPSYNLSFLLSDWALFAEGRMATGPCSVMCCRQCRWKLKHTFKPHNKRAGCSTIKSSPLSTTPSNSIKLTKKPSCAQLCRIDYLVFDHFLMGMQKYFVVRHLFQIACNFGGVWRVPVGAACSIIASEPHAMPPKKPN